MTLSTQNEQQITQFDIIEMMRDKGRLDALDLKAKLDSLDQQTTALMLGMADIFSAILEGGAK